MRQNGKMVEVGEIIMTANALMSLENEILSGELVELRNRIENGSLISGLDDAEKIKVAYTFFKTCHYQECLDICEKILDTPIPIEDSSKRLIQHLTGDCYLALEKFEKALSVYSEILISNNNDSVAFVNRALAKWELGDLEGAIEDFRRCLNLDTRNAVAYRSIGRIHNKLGRYSQAVVALRKSLKIEADNAMALAQLGLAYYHLNRPFNASNRFRMSLQFNPENELAKRGLEILSHAQQRHGK
jgi:tetratricopeptide (TPR) repeat protein